MNHHKVIGHYEKRTNFKIDSLPEMKNIGINLKCLVYSSNCTLDTITGVI